MNTTKKLRDGKIFTIYLEKDHLEHVKRIARKMSMQEGRDISACEAIRMAVQQCYPMGEQMELFPVQPKTRLKRNVDDGQLAFI